MPAKITFVIVTAVAAIGSAVAAGFLAAVVGLAVKMPTATLVTITTESAAAAFGGVIALSGIAAGLFFKTSALVTAPAADKPTTPAGRDSGSRRGSGGALPGPDRSGAAADGELRAAVEAYAVVLEAPHAQWRGSVMRGRAAGGQRRKGLADRLRVRRNIYQR
jgi:hypothetical protein